MVRAPEPLRRSAAPFVSVLVTDMGQVDVEAIEFDFDLTMAVVLMHPDGTVYHRYGSRGPDDATAWTSVDGLCALLDATAAEHRAHVAAVDAGQSLRPWTPAREQAAFAHLFADQKPPDCIHCHTVNDAQTRYAMAKGTWRDAAKWVYPDPRRTGLVLDTADQARVAEVLDGSPAAAAGLRAGDRLQRFGRQSRVSTIADAMWALHGLPADACELPATWTRDGALHEAALALPADWKVCSPDDYAWRPFKWNLSPAPGFGGPPLGADDKRRLGIDADAFAFRVQYIVTWGPRAHRGRAAARAGIRKDDVIVAFAGRSDFASPQHFHAWVRLACRAGQEVEVVLLRDGAERRLRYALPE